MSVFGDTISMIEYCARYFQFVTAAVLLFLLSPIILFFMFLIWIDSGKGVTFKQIRIGKDQKPFTIYKLRTMYSKPPVNEDDLFKKTYVTRIGRLLRELKVDELPQLINIIKGDMNFFGPRPLREKVHRYCMEQIPGFEARYQVLPGIIGLSQILSFTELDHTYLACDLYYINNRSLKLNVLITASTVLYIFHNISKSIYSHMKAFWFHRVEIGTSKALSHQTLSNPILTYSKEN